MIRSILTTARNALAIGGVAIMISLTGCQSVLGPGDELTITYDDGKGEQQQWTLSCDPPGGSHPDPEAACTALDDHGEEVLAPIPKGTPCTAIYGGPQTATMTGTWHGDPVDTKFSRGNGCEIDRWEKMEGLLPKPS